MIKKYIFFIFIIIFIAAAVYWVHQRSATPADEPEIKPIAAVRVVPLNRSKIDKTITTYGTVVAALGQTQTFSVPFECRVREVLVTAGQAVDPNTPMIMISPSPETLLRFKQAKEERNTEKNNVDLVKQRIDLKLATRQDLVAAQQLYEAAELNLKNMEAQGFDKNQTLSAGSKGLVSQISVEQGQIVPAGAPLIATIGQNQISVILGVEMEDIALLQAGQEVQLYQVNAAEKKTVTGNIELVTHRVNQQTRMVDVFVKPRAGANLLLNQHVEATITVGSSEGFVVPRSAVLPEDNQYVLYTVEQGHAVKHIVRIGLKTPERVEVISDQLQQGRPVVTEGNYELENGMSVRVEQDQ